MRSALCIFTAAAALAAPMRAWADGEGLVARVDTVPWASAAADSRPLLRPALRVGFSGSEASGLRLPAFSLLGDVYVGSGTTLRAPPSGFRATSGLIIGSRAQPWGASPVAGSTPLLGERRSLAPTLPYTVVEAAAESATVPYLGFGYSALSIKNGWSFNADLGVMSLNPGSAVRFGSAGNGYQGFGDLVRDLRLSPVLQLGISYTF